MFGGGEEYFQDPPGFDRDTLKRFATFCDYLRHVKKAGKTSIAQAAQLAREVGDTENAYELVIGALFRHIKTWTGAKQLACWYILDKLSKEDRDKYAYTASKYILEVGRDHLHYEDPELCGKYESLVEHWENVFPQHVVDALWVAKKERLWAAAHPAEIEAQLRAEETEWEKEERALEDEDGLNDFGQPCMDYLQGRCTWGDTCRLLHPPGEEGTLPAECRMGDWKCPSCGVINRHYRRRCSNCVREKPQYKRERAVPAEDVLLSHPDTDALRVLSQQFGYNPYDKTEAQQHWALRMDGITVDEYLAERRAAYRVRIAGKPPTNAVEERCRQNKHFPDMDIGPEDEAEEVGRGDTGEGPAKRSRHESLVPANTPLNTAIALLSQMIMERGVRDAFAAQLFNELAKAARALAASTRDDADSAQAQLLAPQQADVFLSACKLGFTAWNANAEAVSFVAPCFKAIRHIEDKLGLSPDAEEQLQAMASTFLA